MKETDQREENIQKQENNVHSDTEINKRRIYHSEHGERRIGRLTQTVYGEGEVPKRVRRAQEQTAATGTGSRGTNTASDASAQKTAADSTDTNSALHKTRIHDETQSQTMAGEAETRRAQNPAAASAAGNRRMQEEPKKTSSARPARQRAESVDDSRQPKAGKKEKVETQPSTWKEKMQARRRLRVRRILTGVLGVVAVAYIGVAIYFGFHFYEGTVIYGIDCSQMTVEEAKQEVAEKLDQYVLTIQERENKAETLSAEQIGLTFVDNNSIDKMLRAQHCYIWPIMMLMEREPVVSVAFEYDKQSVENTMNQLDCFDTLHAVDPKDAYVLLTDTGYVIEKEIMGTTLDHEKTLEVVMEALDAGKQEVSLEEKDCYINPEAYHDDAEIVNEVEAKNALMTANITYDFGTAQEVVNAQVIANWIVELDDGSYVIDDSGVYDYVEELASKYDTFGLPITFYTSLGTTETLSGGDYGWCMDQDQTVLELLQALETGYQGTMEPAYLYTGMSHENNGIGYTYVEICISQQRMWCYENGYCIVDTPVVTGNPNKDNGTPSGGVWAIDAKKRDAILEGEGYSAPVDYWMPFNDDIGIHDLKERAYFGSTIYLTNGSHGCVNTPYEAVQTIYNTVSIGTPVIVYE